MSSYDYGEPVEQTSLRARLPATPEAETFYPPRADWTWRFRPKRLAPLGVLTPFCSVAVRRMLLSLLIPGYAFRLSGWQRTSWLVLTAWCVSLGVLALAIGRLPADLALGLMAAAHVASVTHWIGSTAGWHGWRLRIVLAGTLLAALWSFVYLPMRTGLIDYWATPIRLRNQLVILNPRVKAADIKRGDLIAYQFEGGRRLAQGIYLREGGGLEPVMALPGDAVQFFPDGYEVAGGGRVAALAYMPTNGVIHVPKMHWLIWPRLDIVGQGNDPRNDLTVVLTKAALVSQNQILGRPYHYWLGRRQTLP